MERRGGALALVLSVCLAGLVSRASGAADLPYPGGVWQPPAASYGVSIAGNVPITMSDGVVLRADVYVPSDLETGERAPGTFPVILIQTPYGKGNVYGQGLAGMRPVAEYLTARGYLSVIADVRGFGSSEGTMDFFGPRQTQDGVELVHWCASELEGSNGAVGLAGLSYLGVNQFFTAAAMGPDSPLKAISPMYVNSDTYRELWFDGGIPGAAWGCTGVATVGGPQGGLPYDLLDPTAPYATIDPVGASQTLIDRVGGWMSLYAHTCENIMFGGDRAYDETFWRVRSPIHVLEKIVANGIPALVWEGWRDAFPGGALADYAALQNASFGRPVFAPMPAGGAVTGRYQAILGPWEHAAHYAEDEFNAIQLEWFETWLRNVPTGMDDTTTPLHTFVMGQDRWADTDRYPFASHAETFYLDQGGTLATAAPAEAGRETVLWAPPGPASRARYATEPFGADVVFAGPASVTLFVASTTTNVELIVTLEDVAPDGTASEISQGVLIGSLRAVDDSRSWTDDAGKLVRPFHPFTRASEAPVVPGAVTRYDIEVEAAFTTLRTGHSLRLTVTTQSGPELASCVGSCGLGVPRVLQPTLPQLEGLAGGVYTIERSPAAASFVNVPLLPADSFADSPWYWGPSS